MTAENPLDWTPEAIRRGESEGLRPGRGLPPRGIAPLYSWWYETAEPDETAIIVMLERMDGQGKVGWRLETANRTLTGNRARPTVRGLIRPWKTPEWWGTLTDGEFRADPGFLEEQMRRADERRRMAGGRR